jgi:protein-S-isoprenylcysteine O-methyltransferase Ste14
MMPTLYAQLAYYSWFVLFIVWFIGYFGTKRTLQIPQWGEQVFVLVLLIVAFSLLFNANALPGVFGAQLYTLNTAVGMLGVFVAWVGVVFAIWARVTLGSNWSGAVVTIKKDHALVQHGPYAFVRHPIYSGFLAAALGTAMTLGTFGEFLAVLIILVAFLIRVHREEFMMTTQFPNEYRGYMTRTKALIPFIW